MVFFTGYKHIMMLNLKKELVVLITFRPQVMDVAYRYNMRCHEQNKKYTQTFVGQNSLIV